MIPMMKKKGQAQKKRQNQASKVVLAQENLKEASLDAGPANDSSLAKSKSDLHIANETSSIIEDNVKKQANPSKESDDDEKKKKAGTKRKSASGPKPILTEKKTKSVTVVEASKGYQLHADYWEFLIAAGKKTEKASQEQEHASGSSRIEVDAAAKTLCIKEKKKEQTLSNGCAEKQAVVTSDNSTASKEKPSVYRCELCSRNFATAFALNQHNGAKHQ